MVLSNISQNLGQTIPQTSLHAASVVLPTWEGILRYQNGDEKIITALNGHGYPRFHMHKDIKKLNSKFLELYGKIGDDCMIFMSHQISETFKEYMIRYSEGKMDNIRVMKFFFPIKNKDGNHNISWPFSVIFYPESDFTIAKSFRIITGMGLNSRLASYLLKVMFGINRKLDVEYDGKLLELDLPDVQMIASNENEELKPEITSLNHHKNKNINNQFLNFSSKMFSKVKESFANMVNKSSRSSTYYNEWTDVQKNDVYLYPSGMGSIFSIHKALLSLFGTSKKSVCFGFSYVDTKTILEKFGAGTYFIGFGDDDSLDKLECQLRSNEIHIFALFCELPSNPLLKTPNLLRIKELANKYNFAVVIDETIGNFTNISALPFADVIVTSLTKIISGECDLMAGSAILNPSSLYYGALKNYFNINYEITLWLEELVLLEQRSKSLPERSKIINNNTEAVVDILKRNSLISDVFYPNLTSGKEIYEKIKTPKGGYGGLFSVVFHDPSAAIIFFDNLNVNKGPSLGTNFTLACPFTLLAHFNELNEVEKWGVDRNLIRVSIGLEDKQDLIHEFERCLDITRLLLNK